MGMTTERGLEAAVQLVQRNLTQYEKAVVRYGNIVDAYLGEAPRTLFFAHLLRVNPTLYQSPSYKDYRVGFMGVTPFQANNAEVELSKIAADPAVCAYVYSRELNRVSYDLYTTYSNLFTETAEDLWRCAYLRTTLGDPAFNLLWSLHIPTSDDESVYNVLRDSVNTLNKTLVSYSVPIVKELVLKDCEFVFQMVALKGTFLTTGAGIEPVPASDAAATIFTRVRNG